ncbi:MAG: hypothetical protein HQK55_02980 [Deltaproteobacteria bacterium]|nr:hypothetical protein [Deltaproteobacteria bacterium]
MPWAYHPPKDQYLLDLETKRDTLKERLARLADELNRTNHDLEVAQKQFKTGRTTLALNRRQAKDLQDEIFFLEKRRREFNNEIYSVAQALERSDQEKNRLNDEVKIWRQKVAEIQSEVSHVEIEIKELSEAFQLAQGQRVALSEEKQVLSTEISSRLSGIFHEKEEVEEQLFKVAVSFREFIEERQNISQALRDRDKLITHLNKEIDDLEHQAAIINIIKELQDEKTAMEEALSSKKKSYLRLREALSEHQTTAKTYTDRLHKLTEAMANLRQSVAKTEEAVAPYQQALNQVQTAQNEEAETMEILRDREKELLRLLAEKTELETQAGILSAQLESLGNLEGIAE